MLDSLDVAAIRYTTNTNRDLYTLLEQLKLRSPWEGHRSYPARQVTLTLAERDHPDVTFEVTAYFSAPPSAPSAYEDSPGCVVLPDEIPGQGRGFELFGALFAAKRYSTFPCVFQAGVDTPTETRPSGG